MGMPENVAEYIQALSRVGRRYPALVIVLFDPLRERDQSYYKYFNKFHEMYELLIGSTPLNRFQLQQEIYWLVLDIIHKSVFHTGK